jgi:hypothetical protein
VPWPATAELCLCYAPLPDRANWPDVARQNQSRNSGTSPCNQEIPSFNNDIQGGTPIALVPFSVSNLSK